MGCGCKNKSNGINKQQVTRSSSPRLNGRRGTSGKTIRRIIK